MNMIERVKNTVRQLTYTAVLGSGVYYTKKLNLRILKIRTLN